MLLLVLQWDNFLSNTLDMQTGHNSTNYENLPSTSKEQTAGVHVDNYQGISIIFIYFFICYMLYNIFLKVYHEYSSLP